MHIMVTVGFPNYFYHINNKPMCLPNYLYLLQQLQNYKPVLMKFKYSVAQIIKREVYFTDLKIDVFVQEYVFKISNANSTYIRS